MYVPQAHLGREFKVSGLQVDVRLLDLRSLSASAGLCRLETPMCTAWTADVHVRWLRPARLPRQRTRTRGRAFPSKPKPCRLKSPNIAWNSAAQSPQPKSRNHLKCSPPPPPPQLGAPAINELTPLSALASMELPHSTCHKTPARLQALAFRNLGVLGSRVRGLKGF